MRMLAFGSLAIAALSMTAADAGERRPQSRETIDSLVIYSGGIPAIEIRTNRENTACIYSSAAQAKPKRTKAVFALY